MNKDHHEVRYSFIEYKQYGGNYTETSWAGNHTEDYSAFFDHVGHPSDADTNIGALVSKPHIEKVKASYGSTFASGPPSDNAC